MIRKALRALPAVALLLLAAGEVRAGGLGLYGSYGSGKVSAKRDSAAGNYSFDQTSTHAGGGVVYDSNVLENRPFNWRGALVFEKMDDEVDGGDRAFADGLKSEYGGGIVLENDFGYGARAGSRVRFWGGLGTRLSFHTGQDGNNVGPRDQKVFGLGAGPVAGVNVGVSESLALSLKGGYLFTGYMGRWSDWTVDPHQRMDMSATEGCWYLGLAVLVKTGDQPWGGEDVQGEGGKEDF